ncbi:MAG: prephenate dehydratase domain-containing protein, partial [Candidatus Latescibacteria bacterium]|nr:prephenate dehydratase domain-containing protein [Candidatus Latescibacterota bacterium]
MKAPYIVAVQGELGSNSALAAAAHFHEERISIQPCPTFNELFEAVDKGQAHYGMAPVENSLAGSIHAVWDLLVLYKPAIVGEIYYHVRHCLIGHPGARLEDIRYVYSHPQALAQCGAFLLELENLDPNNIVEEYDTAG